MEVTESMTCSNRKNPIAFEDSWKDCFYQLPHHFPKYQAPYVSLSRLIDALAAYSCGNFLLISWKAHLQRPRDNLIAHEDQPYYISTFYCPA